MPERIYLTGRTLNGWEDVSDATMALIQKYIDLGRLWHASDTPGHVDILCQIIDGIDGEIWNDRDDRVMSKDEAKRYVRDRHSAQSRMARNPVAARLERIEAIARQIADFPPPRKRKHAYTAGVKWTLIEELREALGESK